MKRNAKASLVLLAAFSCSFLLSPAKAQSVEELKAALAQQRALTADLAAKIKRLEDENTRLKTSNAASVEGQGTPVSTDKALGQVKAPVTAQSESSSESIDDDGALEIAFKRTGLAVLSPGRVIVTPTASWAHNGTNAYRGTSDVYSSSVDARIGLPLEFMIAVRGSYVLNSQPSRNGKTQGFGDPSVRIYKQIVAPGGAFPSVVINAGYDAPIGDKAFSGFERFSGGISLSKSISPVAFYGSVSYSHPMPRDFDGLTVTPSDAFSGAVGASLAVTPGISTSLGVSMTYEDGYRLSQGELTAETGSSLAGYLNHEWDFVLNKSVSLSLSGQMGITDDATDFIFGVGMPVKF